MRVSTRTRYMYELAVEENSRDSCLDVVSGLGGKVVDGLQADSACSHDCDVVRMLMDRREF